MLRPPLQGLQNQQVQRPLQKLDSVVVPLSLLSHRLVLRQFLPMFNHAPRKLFPCRLFARSLGYDVMTLPFVPSKAVDILLPNL